MRMVKLTAYLTGRSIYICPNQVVSIGEADDMSRRLINMMDETTVMVSETLDEVAERIDTARGF